MRATIFRAIGHAAMAVILLFAVRIQAGPLRAFTNPLNKEALDLFLVVDESKPFMTIMNFGLMKSALNNIVTDLNPGGSSPYFGIYFYGSTTAVDMSVAYPTTSAANVKLMLDNKYYSPMQSNASTLSSALSAIYSKSGSNNRETVPRVTLIISSSLSSSDQAIIQQLERDRGMTVIIVGVGSNINTSFLNRFASHPSEYYAMHVGDFFQLTLLSNHISSLISDVPRPLAITSPIIASLINGLYHTVQINTASYTVYSDVMVMFASNCTACVLYSSLSVPIPTSANSLRSTVSRSFFAGPGYPDTLSYFRVPQDTIRFYVSLLGNGASSAYITCDVFTLPQMMSINTRSVPTNDPLLVIG